MTTPRPLTIALAAACALAVAPVAAGKDGDGGSGSSGGGSGRDGRVEIRVAGNCGKGATSKLRLRGEDGEIEVTFEVDHTRANVRWQVAIVHERRVAFRGTARTGSPSASLEVERTLTDLPGADAVTARAWGPNGLTCLASGVLP